jgi:hypothetical protein
MLTRPQKPVHGPTLTRVAESLAPFAGAAKLAPAPEATKLEQGALGALDGLLRFSRGFRRFRIGLAAWSVRILWPLCALWAAWDGLQLARGVVPRADLPQAYDDLAMRGTIAAVLFVIWLFLFRRRGAFTVNRGGRLEK